MPRARTQSQIRRYALLGLTGVALLAAMLACSRSTTEVIYITATPEFDEFGNLVIQPTPTPNQPTNTPIQPTPNPTRTAPQLGAGGTYVVQAGDTLGTIASQFGIAIEDILAANALLDPDVLEVGQTVIVPRVELAYGPDNKILPDSELVYGPNSASFGVAGFVKFQPGFLKTYTENFEGKIWSGVEIIDFVARSYSVNPRLLLALLEYRSGWLTTSSPSEEDTLYPMGIVSEGREGLMRQMLSAADSLNAGYYGWKYRGLTSIVFTDGPRVLFAPTLNPGTVGVQYMLSRGMPSAQWQREVHPSGFFETYMGLFGDPFALAFEPITPLDLAQPQLTLPFAAGEEWVYTGGPHGAYNSGSAWGAIDFAPPKPPDELVVAQGACYISPQWATAAAPGIIARSGEGYVILDLDGDGNEHTGWVLVYLHIDDFERIAAGTVVETGDRLGHPSCQGGISNGTHLHLARRYNGEWIPVACEACAPGVSVPPFVLGEWTVFGFPNQEYQGYMTRPGDDGYRQAEQTRDYLLNRIMW